MTSTERRFPHYGNGEPSYRRKWALILLSMPIGVVVQCLLCSVLCFAILQSVSVLLPDRNMLATYFDSKEHNKRTVQQMLKFVQENPKGPFPKKDVDWHVQNMEWTYVEGDPQCWTWLQDAVAQKSNQYLLSAYDNGMTRNPRDVDDSIVQVDFADGLRVKMVFYQERLVACSRN